MDQTPDQETPVKQDAVEKVVAKKAPEVKKVAATKKAAIASKPAQAPEVKVAPAKPAKPVKLKVKLVRDSFTMPADDWALIEQLKTRALGFKHPAKKSDLLRAGLQVLASLPDNALKAALDKLQPLKPGRPKADKK
jgi:hypothetical protein